VIGMSSLVSARRVVVVEQRQAGQRRVASVGDRVGVDDLVAGLVTKVTSATFNTFRPGVLITSTVSSSVSSSVSLESPVATFSRSTPASICACETVAV